MPNDCRIFVVVRNGRAVISFYTYKEAVDWKSADGRDSLNYTVDWIPLAK